MDQERQTKSRRPVFLVVAGFVFVLAASGVVLWTLNSRVDDLQARLSGMQQRATSAEQEAARRSRELKTLEGELAVTRERALRAEDLTEQLEATNRESATQVEQLREYSEASAAAALRAAQERQQALGELESMRERREKELDRMQQALNRIAPTVRTPSGMLLQLADESFRFDFDSAALKTGNREILSRIAGILLASEGYRLFIDGHTDDVGTEAYNQQLSERRTASVRDYLVQAGVPASSISVKGFGKSNPLVSEKTRAARQKNRRVEIGIVDTIIDYETASVPKPEQ